MKTFEELTNLELINLTKPEIEKYAMLAAAESGFIIPGPEPEPYLGVSPRADTVLYVIAGLKFGKRENAIGLQAHLMQISDQLLDTEYDWTGGRSAYRVKGFDGDFAITEDIVFSGELYEKCRHELAEHGKLKKENDEARATWKKERDAFDNQYEWIYTKISDAHDLRRKHERNQEQFARYLEVADGDGVQAWKFFLAAGLQIKGFLPEGAVTVEPPKWKGHETDLDGKKVEDEKPRSVDDLPGANGVPSF